VSAVGDLNATVAGRRNQQSGGTLAANGNTTLMAGTLDNSAGTAAAVKGNLNVTTTGQTTNDAGTSAGGRQDHAVCNGGLSTKAARSSATA
jgi:filamentous hemagglutinin